MQYDDTTLAMIRQRLSHVSMLQAMLDGKELQGLCKGIWLTPTTQGIREFVLERGNYEAYRIKPRIARYRLGLWDCKSTLSVGSIEGAPMSLSPEEMRHQYHNFVRWLGDVQEVEA